MLYRSDDPEADFNRLDAQRAKDEANLPHCDYCGEVIYESYYEINGEIICEECMASHFKRNVEIFLD